MPWPGVTGHCRGSLYVQAFEQTNSWVSRSPWYPHATAGLAGFCLRGDDRVFHVPARLSQIAPEIEIAKITIGQLWVAPPSMVTDCPVIKPASREHRNKTVPVISSGVAGL